MRRRSGRTRTECDNANVDTIVPEVQDPDGLTYTVEIKRRGVPELRAPGIAIGLVAWLVGWVAHGTVFRREWKVIVRRRGARSRRGGVWVWRLSSRDAAELEQDRLTDIIEQGRFRGRE